MRFEHILFYDLRHHFRYILTPLFRYSLFIFVLYVIDVYSHILQDCFKTRPNSSFSHIFLTSQRLKISSFSIILTIFFHHTGRRGAPQQTGYNPCLFKSGHLNTFLRQQRVWRDISGSKRTAQPPGEQLRARHSGLFWHIFRHTYLISHHLELFRKIRQFSVFYWFRSKRSIK